VRGWALSAAFTLAAGALALPASPARPQSLADTARVRRWREDLAFVVDRVTTVHPRPFAFSSRAAFDSAAAAIGQRIATTDDAGLAADCMRLVASLGDGHTMRFCRCGSDPAKTGSTSAPPGRRSRGRPGRRW